MNEKTCKYRQHKTMEDVKKAYSKFNYPEKMQIVYCKKCESYHIRKRKTNG